MKRKLVMIAAVVALSVAVSAQAVPIDPLTVEYILAVDANGPGTFTITADVSLDNGGLATYGIELSGFDTLDNLGPMVNGMDITWASWVMGFTMFRSAANDVQLAAAQDTVTVGAVMVYGFGQSAGTLIPPAGWAVGPTPIMVQEDYDAPLLLAEGTYTGSFGLDNVVSYTAVVFEADSGTDAIGIPQGLNVIFTPEPATMSLLLIGAVGALVRRRR